MQQNFNTVTRARAGSVIETNSVIKNTYMLLSMTLVFSAVMAVVAMATGATPMNPLMVLAGIIGLNMLVAAMKDSVWGIPAVFLFTGFFGYTLGPVLTMYTHAFINGSQIIAAALGLTGAIFFALSGYAMTTRKDFSYMGGFLFAGITVVFVASLMSIFFQVPAMHLAISCGFVLLSAGFILYETSQIIHGGEKNYLMATISLYVQLYNLFISLLHILAAFAGRRD